MVIKSVMINNFKSIGQNNNVLYVEDTVTALIGKNESGKSNVLGAIGRLDKLYLPLNAQYTKLLTRGQDNAPTVSLRLEFSAADILVFPSACGDTTLFYTDSEVAMEGGLSELILHDDELNADIETLFTALRSKEFKLTSSQISTLNTQMERLRGLSQKVYAGIFSDVSAIRGLIRPANVSNKDELMALVDRVEIKIRKYYNLFPQMFYRVSNEILKDTYSFEEIKKLMDSDNIFHNLMIAARVDKDTLFKAFQGPTEASKKTYKMQVIDKIKALTTEFNRFYQQEDISFDFDIEGQNAKLYVHTANMYMSFSERSNGLKWYFSLFVDVRAKTTADRPIVYLLDEPGVHLHVNAQKQLVALFNHLCRNGNQIIYTTHSPFMIDGNNVYNVRVIEKGTDGLSKIFRSVHSYNLNQETKVETLTPLTQALGMDIKYNIGPKYNKMNLVVEGVTDCMYLTAMIKHFNISEEHSPNIIPCVGVDAVHLMVSILIGWGCAYKVVVDYDTQGFNQYKKITQKSGLADTCNVFFVNCKTASSESDVKSPNNATTESLVAEEDNNKLANKYDGTNATKTLAAKEFMDRVLRNEIDPSEETSNNFRQLFKVLGIMT